MFLTLLFLQEEDEPEIGAQRDPRGPVGAAVQEGLWLLWQSCLAGLLLQVLEGGIPQGQAEADPRGLGAGRAVKNLLFFLQGDCTKFSSCLLFPSPVCSGASQIPQLELSSRDSNLPFDAKMDVYDILL